MLVLSMLVDTDDVVCLVEVTVFILFVFLESVSDDVVWVVAVTVLVFSKLDDAFVDSIIADIECIVTIP